MPGRPAKPVALHVLQGTDQPCRMADRGAELALPPSPVGEPPEYFGDIARAEWEALTSHPQYAQVLNPVHRGVLIQYCLLHEKMVRQAKGEDKMTASELQTLNSLRMQLGLTPAAQSKVRMPEKPREESPWADTKPILMSKPA